MQESVAVCAYTPPYNAPLSNAGLIIYLNYQLHRSEKGKTPQVNPVQVTSNSAKFNRI